MRIKVYSLVVLAIALVAVSAAAVRAVDTVATLEYQVKAAFLYNFMRFIDWPAEEASSKEALVIGIIGEDPFGDAFTPVKDKQVKGRDVVFKRFKGLGEMKKAGEKDQSAFKQEIETVRKCHLLFICSSEKNNLGEIIQLLQGSPVLTVGEMDNLIESGGVIKFLMESKKVRFEISLTAAEKTGLKVRSQLLRLAKKVIGKSTSGNNNEG